MQTMKLFLTRYGRAKNLEMLARGEGYISELKAQLAAMVAVVDDIVV